MASWLYLNFRGDSCSYLGVTVVPVIQKEKNGLSPTLDNWKIWFIGFTEGDGSLYMRNGRRQFNIYQKELKILEQIKSTLGIGTITFDPSSRIYGLYTYKVEDIFRLYNIFNNNLVIPHRIRQLNVWYPAYLIRNLSQLGRPSASTSLAYVKRCLVFWLIRC